MYCCLPSCGERRGEVRGWRERIRRKRRNRRTAIYITVGRVYTCEAGQRLISFRDLWKSSSIYVCMYAWVGTLKRYHTALRLLPLQNLCIEAQFFSAPAYLDYAAACLSFSRFSLLDALRRADCASRENYRRRMYFSLHIFRIRECVSFFQI